MKKLSNKEKTNNIDLGMRRGAAQALARHKRDGIPIAIMQDGNVVLVQPEDIIVPTVD